MCRHISEASNSLAQVTSIGSEKLQNAWSPSELQTSNLTEHLGILLFSVRDFLKNKYFFPIIMEKQLFSPWEPGKPWVPICTGIETSKLHVQKVLILPVFSAYEQIKTL